MKNKASLSASIIIIVQFPCAVEIMLETLVSCSKRIKKSKSPLDIWDVFLLMSICSEVWFF